MSLSVCSSTYLEHFVCPSVRPSVSPFIPAEKKMPINHRLRHFLFFFAGVAAGFIVGKMIVAVGSAADVYLREDWFLKTGVEFPLLMSEHQRQKIAQSQLIRSRKH